MNDRRQFERAESEKKKERKKKMIVRSNAGISAFSLYTRAYFNTSHHTNNGPKSLPFYHIYIIYFAQSFLFLVHQSDNDNLSYACPTE